jgi:CRP/FNR family transcriptional regulator
MCPTGRLPKPPAELDRALTRFNMFAGLTKAQLKALADIAQRRRFTKGEAIFFEGQETSGFYLVEEGRIKVFKISPDGKEHILHIVEPGFSFAEACIFFEERTCPASASALEDTQTIFFPKDALVEELNRNCAVGLKMLGSMAAWIRLMAEQVGSLSLRTVEGRLVNYLVLLAKRLKVPFADGQTLTLDVEKGVLASRLGTIPETLSRAFKKLQDSELIKVERGNLTIVDAQGLLDMLE